jgi:hypothetical protein
MNDAPVYKPHDPAGFGARIAETLPENAPSPVPLVSISQSGAGGSQANAAPAK